LKAKDETYTINLLIADATVKKVELSATSSDKTVAETDAIEYEGAGEEREVIVTWAGKSGTTKIAITATDEHGQESVVVTVVLSVKAWIGVDPEKLACYWSFDNAKDPGLADFAKNGGTLKSSYSDLNPGEAGTGGNAIAGKSAFFNNNDNKYYKFNSDNRCYFEAKFTFSIWMKHVSCSNNQIPIVFGNKNAGETCGSFVDAHNPMRFETCQTGGYSWNQRSNDWYSCGDSRSINKWHMHTVTSDGSEFRAFVDGKDYGKQTNQGWHDISGEYVSFMGVYPGWGSNGLYGFLDEVIMWDRALTAEEVKKLYNMNMNGVGYKVNI